MSYFNANAAAATSGHTGDVRAGVSNTVGANVGGIGNGYIRVHCLPPPCAATRSRIMGFHASNSQIVAAPKNTGTSGGLSDPIAEFILEGFYKDSKYTSDKMKMH